MSYDLSMFACPGRDLAEPEEMIPCYRAGHPCPPLKPYRDENETHVTIHYACPCCGSGASTVSYPKEWVENNPRFEDQVGDIARRLNGE